MMASMSTNLFKFYRLKREWQRDPLSTIFMDFSYNNIAFTVVYSTRENSLLLLKKGAKQVQAELIIPLLDDFQINTYLDGLYHDIVTFLEIEYNPNNKFKPFNFFKRFDDNFKIRSHAQISEVTYLNRTRKLEDPDAIFYYRIIPHEGKNNGHVTQTNLEKTSWLLPKFYARHKDDDISVAYTSDEHKAKPIPQEYQ